jgi:carboxylesterase
MLHGFGDTPQTLGILGDRIAEAGFRVRAPLFPGHGRTPQEFFVSTATEWVASARDSLLEMRSLCSSVAVVGLSMGGAIGVLLAAEFTDMPALVLLSPYVRMPLRLWLAAATHRTWGPLAGSLYSRHPESIRDPDERKKNRGYGVINGHALGELSRIVDWSRSALGQVTCPTLLVQSRKDPRIRPSIAIEALRLLGAPKRKLVWVDDGGHIISVDYGREKVFNETIAWLLANQTGQPTPPQQATA